MLTFAKTLTASSLAKEQMQLRLQYPQNPYRLPDERGGYLILQRYGVVDGMMSGCNIPIPQSPSCGCKSGSNTTCGASCCNNTKPKDHCTPNPWLPQQQAELVRLPQLVGFEIIQYSGYSPDDKQMVVLTKRGCEGSLIQDWAAGTLVTQAWVGADYDKLQQQITDLTDKLKKCCEATEVSV